MQIYALSASDWHAMSHRILWETAAAISWFPHGFNLNSAGDGCYCLSGNYLLLSSYGPS